MASGIFRPKKLAGYKVIDDLVSEYKDKDYGLWAEAVRWLILNDLFYFVTRAGTTRGLVNKTTGIPIFERQFTLDRCREIERHPEEPLIWAIIFWVTLIAITVFLIAWGLRFISGFFY